MVAVRPSEPIVARVNIPRAAAVLAGQLRQQILSGALAEGALLPAERSLVAEAGVGRASVREALRILETEGLIASRLGRYGGWEVRQPGADTVSRSIDVFIRGRQISLTSVLEAREALEPGCAALAALHRTEADLATLDACDERLEACWRDLDAYLAENVRWHLAVVDASHNAVLVAMMAALADAIHAGTDLDGFNSETVRRAALDAHRGVVSAIRAQDSDAASRRMHRHVHAFRVAAGGASSAPHVRRVKPRTAAQGHRPDETEERHGAR